MQCLENLVYRYRVSCVCGTLGSFDTFSTTPIQLILVSQTDSLHYTSLHFTSLASSSSSKFLVNFRSIVCSAIEVQEEREEKQCFGEDQ